MQTYSPSPNEYEVKETKVEAVRKDFSLSKTMLWFGIGLLISGAVAFGLPSLLDAVCATDDAFFTAFIVIYIVSVVIMLPCSLIVHFKAFSKKTIGITIAYVLYSIAMGALLSTVFVQVMSLFGNDTIPIIAVAFLVTSGIFLMMGAIGYFSKKNLSMLFMIIFPLLIGAMILSLINFFLGLELVYWIVSFVLLFVVILYPAIHMNAIRKMSEDPKLAEVKALSIYCAFILYVDFINIFIRILYYVLIIFAKHKD